MTFAEQVANFAQRTERRLAKTVSGAATKLASNIVMATPIDQNPTHDENSVGEARAGWVAGYSAEIRSIPNLLDPVGNATVARIGQVFSTYSPRTQRELYLVNSVSYAPLLEFGGYKAPMYPIINREKTLPTGFSFQAPYGMMHVNAKAWPSLVSNAARVSRTVR